METFEQTSSFQNKACVAAHKTAEYHIVENVFFHYILSISPE